MVSVQVVVSDFYRVKRKILRILHNITSKINLGW